MGRYVKPPLKQDPQHPFYYISNGNLYKRALELYEKQVPNEPTGAMSIDLFRNSMLKNDGTLKINNDYMATGVIDHGYLSLHSAISQPTQTQQVITLNCEIEMENQKAKTIRIPQDQILGTSKEPDGTLIITLKD